MSAALSGISKYSVDYREGVVYATDADFRRDKPSIAILANGQLYVAGARVENPVHFRSALRPESVSTGLNGERIERFKEVGAQTTLRRITARGQTWWDVDDVGGQA